MLLEEPHSSSQLGDNPCFTPSAVKVTGEPLRSVSLPRPPGRSSPRSSLHAPAAGCRTQAFPHPQQHLVASACVWRGSSIFLFPLSAKGKPFVPLGRDAKQRASPPLPAAPEDASHACPRSPHAGGSPSPLSPFPPSRGAPERSPAGSSPGPRTPKSRGPKKFGAGRGAGAQAGRGDPAANPPGPSPPQNPVPHPPPVCPRPRPSLRSPALLLAAC